MTSLDERIEAASERNDALLKILSECEHAPPALEQQQRYVADLDQQLKQTQQRLAQLDKERQKEFKEHQKYRDSVMRRFVYKVGRQSEKFEQRAAKEEREYFDVLQEAHKMQQREKDLGAVRDDSVRVQQDLEVQAKRNSQAQDDLDHLYRDLFEGHTVGYEEEDRAEDNRNKAEKVYRDGKTKAENESLVLNNLSEAFKRIQSALAFTEEALSYSRMDMWGGSSMWDMMERNALHKAEMQVTDAQWLVTQAKRLSPMVVGLPPVKIAQGNIMSDVFFDNIFTDMAFHEKIHQSREELVLCADALQKQIAAAKGRHQELEWHVKDKAVELQEARSKLQKARRDIFELVNKKKTGQAGMGESGEAGIGESDPSPPAYEE